MKTIKTIFALFLLTVYSGVTSKDCHHAKVLIFPQAAPVQFWLTGCNTYNETIPKGVHYKCFCHPWKCSDVISIPFRDTFDAIPIENIVAITLPDLDEWQTSELDSDWIEWNEGSSPDVDLPFGSGFFNNSSSEYLYVDYEFESGKDYSISVDFSVIPGGGGGTNPNVTGRVYILDEGFNVIYQGNSSTSISTVSFSASESTSRVAFRSFRSGGTKTSVFSTVIVSASGTRTDITYDYPDPNNYDLVIYDEDDEEIDRVSFDAVLNEAGLFYYYTAVVNLSELNICEQQIRFQVENLSISPDEVVAKSDCHNVTDSDYNPTILIEYSSPNNFNGLVFEGVSPEISYNIRIPAIFFHEDNPQEDEVAELSSKVIKLNSKITAKKRLDVDFIPYYMHTKLTLILSMPILLIEGLYWTKQDAYQKEEGNKRWPHKPATCWLTQRDFLERQSL